MKLRKYAAAVMLGLTGMFFGCSPDNTDSNGTTPKELDASFTVTQTSANRYMLEASNIDNTIVHQWSTGVGYATGGATREIFLPDVGTYTITHTAVGIGGVGYSSSQTIEVTVADPIAGNLVRGGHFETAEDIAEWTTFPATVNGSAWTFDGGMATITGSQNWNHQNLYQTIEVEGGHTYKLDLFVSGNGSQETYMEWYAGYNPPVQGSDYNEGGQIIALNTWAGCATSPFSGMISDVGCGDTMNGLKYFPTSGTIYLLVRSASGQAAANPFSINIDNVEFRRID